MNCVASVLIKVCVVLLGAALAFIWDKIKCCKNEKIRLFAEKAASIVERVYSDMSGGEKREAFIALCRENKINAKKALKYLEEHIIPTSKQINTYMPQTDIKAASIPEENCIEGAI